jgi:hypothetical protein
MKYERIIEIFEKDKFLTMNVVKQNKFKIFKKILASVFVTTLLLTNSSSKIIVKSYQIN